MDLVDSTPAGDQDDAGTPLAEFASLALPFDSFPPEQASTVAAQVDALYLFLVGISLFFGLLIAVLVVGFAVRYRRRSEDEKTPHIHGSALLEIAWSAIPLAIVMVVFFWSATVYFEMQRPPERPWRSTWSASSGCGRSSTPTASGRSTTCTCPPASRSS